MLPDLTDQRQNTDVSKRSRRTGLEERVDLAVMQLEALLKSVYQYVARQNNLCINCFVYFMVPSALYEKELKFVQRVTHFLTEYPRAPTALTSKTHRLVG